MQALFGTTAKSCKAQFDSGRGQHLQLGAAHQKAAAASRLGAPADATWVVESQDFMRTQLD